MSWYPVSASRSRIASRTRWFVRAADRDVVVARASRNTIARRT
jgi:hypothetical protein